MKYLILLCDGMADIPCEALGGKTPMEKAKKPNMDDLALRGEVGLAKTVADGLKPGSDVANLAVMGYNPMECYTGRSPLEAASMGVKLLDSDVALRCNLVTLSDDENFEDKIMMDYCADDISTTEAAELIAAAKEAFDSDKYTFYKGISYRHCLVVASGTTDLGEMTPPHDISGKKIGKYLSTSPNSKSLIGMMKASSGILKNHPINQQRIKNGKKPANSIWLWGEGKKPHLEDFSLKYGKKIGIVSAVDLIKGIGICANMAVAEVEGATGYIDTNFSGKANAAIDLFQKGIDAVYVHIEAPDECGHRGEVQNKVKAIEMIDQKVLAPIIEKLKEWGDYRVLIMPDHPTPLEIKTHTSDPVPYLFFDSTSAYEQCGGGFNEKAAAETGIYNNAAYTLMKRLLA